MFIGLTSVKNPNKSTEYFISPTKTELLSKDEVKAQNVS